MCEPCTRRTAACASTPVVRVRTSSTHGPAALTMVRARMVSRLPVSHIFGRDLPDAVGPPDLGRASPGPDDRAAGHSIERVEQDQPRVVDEAVGIFEGAAEPALRERFARGIRREIERPGRRQKLPAAEVIIEKQPEPQQPGRPQLLMMRKDEAQRLDDVRRHPPQHLALDQRLADQAKLIIFEVAQAAVDQLGRPGRRPAGQVVHFTKENGKSASCGVAGDAAAVNSAANDGEVVDLVQALPRQSLSNVAILFRIGVDTQSKAKATGIHGSFNRRLFGC